ncbi:PAS domain S-box protein [Clostridiaceae bacterium 35-E11]
MVENITKMNVDKLKKILDQIQNVVVITDIDGNINYVNKKFLQVSGYEYKEIIGKNPRLLKSGETPFEAYKELWDTVLAGKVWRGEFHNKKKTGELYWERATISPIFDEKGNITDLVAIKEDITETKRMEEDLKRSEEEVRKERDKAQKYFDMAGAMMIVIDKDQSVRLVNQKGAEILGYQEVEMLGKNWFDHFLPQSIKIEAKEVFEKLMREEDEALEYYENLIVTKNGEEKIIEWHNAVLRNEKNEITGILSAGQDITHRKEVERMKSELINTVSHELRTPLASIMGFTELLLLRELEENKRKKYLQTMYKEAQRLTNLINDFLDIQRMESGKQIFEKKELRLEEVVDEVLELYANERTHEFVIKKDRDLPFIYGDADKIKQLFTNLISNAIKYSPEGKRVMICIYQKDKNVQVAIKDDGLGIPKEAIPQLFKKFYRVDNSDHRKIGGTGLGLAICKEIVEAHLGKIWVESKAGIGSTFIFTLPASEKTLPEGNNESLEESIVSA